MSFDREKKSWWRENFRKRGGLFKAETTFSRFPKIGIYNLAPVECHNISKKITQFTNMVYIGIALELTFVSSSFLFMARSRKAYLVIVKKLPTKRTTYLVHSL